MTLLPAAAGLLALAGAASGPAGAAGAGPSFVDVAAAAGLVAPTWCGGPDKDHILESVGTGAAFLDFDGDGRLDVYLVSGWRLDEDPSAVAERAPNRLYRNRGDGTFEDVTDASGAGDGGWGCGVCAGDFDVDGRIDLYVTNFGPNRLYRNRGDGTFEDVSEAAGVDDPGWGEGAAFFDADGDGDLDLYVANYIDASMDDVLAARRTSRWRDTAHVMAGPFGLRGGRDVFYRNRGDGTFEDATVEAGMEDVAEAYGMGVVAADLDDDGAVDVYVANDSNPNFLYHNRGGTFAEIGAWCGAGFSGDGAAQAGMGVDAGDLDGDGRYELVVTNFARDRHTLYANVGETFYEDVSAVHGLREATFARLGWGCSFLDHDLDGDLDLFFVHGHIYPQVDDFPELEESYRQLPLLLENREGVLVDVTAEGGPGLAIPFPARGLAVGDFDDDGDPDLLVTGIDVPPLLLRNDTVRVGRWLKLRLLGPAGSPALNARARVHTGPRVQTNEVRSGSTFMSQSSTDLLFGLGSAAVVDSVVVRWPDGRESVERDVAPDRLLVLRPPP